MEKPDVRGWQRLIEERGVNGPALLYPKFKANYMKKYQLNRWLNVILIAWFITTAIVVTVVIFATVVEYLFTKNPWCTAIFLGLIFIPIVITINKVSVALNQSES